MCCLKFILIPSLVSCVTLLPVDNISINDLYKDLNESLKRDIKNAIKNETKIEIGDTFTHKNNQSESKITIEAFSFTSNNFPVIFKPGNESVVEDKEIIPIKGDFDDSTSVYKIENESSEEINDTTEATKEISSTKKSKDEKLISEASTQTILTNV